jgi:hypothetical protein
MSNIFKVGLATAASMGLGRTIIGADFGTDFYETNIAPIVLGGYGKPPKTKPNPNPTKKQKKRKAAHKARIMSRKAGR